MARDFNGSSDEINVSSTPITATPLTIAAWFNSDSQTTNQSLVQINDGTVNNYWSLQLQGAAAGDPVRAAAANAGTASSADSTVGYTASTWQHGCAVFASATSRASYLNGTNKGTNGTNRTPGAVSEIDIGHRDGTIFLDGRIAEVGIWDIDLTDDEVASLAKGVSPLFIRPEKLVFYAPVIGNNSPEQDLMGGLGLTLTGTSKADHPATIYPYRPLITQPPSAGGDAETAAPSDTITLSDANTKTVVLSKSDTVTLSDANTKVVVLAKSDTVTLSDANTKAIKPAKADTVTLSDANTKVVVLSKSDTITMSDALIDLTTAIKADTITLSDSTAKTITKPASDSLTLTDAIAKAIGERQADTITLSDSFSRVAQFVLALSDTMTMNDSLSRAASYLRSSSDTISMSDSFNYSNGAVVAQSLGITLESDEEDLMALEAY